MQTGLSQKHSTPNHPHSLSFPIMPIQVTPQLVRSRFFARMGVSALVRYLALASVSTAATMAPTNHDAAEEIGLARKSHERNGSDNLRDGEDLPELAPSLTDELPQIERETFALADSASLLTSKERRDLHRATIRAKARVLCA